MNKDLQIAKKTVQTEIQALKKLSASFNRSSQFSRVVNLISKMGEKIIISRNDYIHYEKSYNFSYVHNSLKNNENH